MKSKRVSSKVDVVCDVCGNPIRIQKSSLKHMHFPDGIYFDYFDCKFCRAKYVTLVTDSELRKDIQRRGFSASSSRMKMRALELKIQYVDRVKELP